MSKDFKGVYTNYTTNKNGSQKEKSSKKEEIIFSVLDGSQEK